MAKPIGCARCQEWIRQIIDKGLCPPHPDVTCGDCGEREARVYRSIQAKIRSKARGIKDALVRTMTAPFDHATESARAARAAHGAMMKHGGALRMFVYYRPGRIEAFDEMHDPRAGEKDANGDPAGEKDANGDPVWHKAWPEPLPTNLTGDQMVAYFAQRTGRLPYLPTEGK